MDYPIPATITDVLVYDKEATIVLNENPDYYLEQKLSKRTANQLSRIVRDSERHERNAVMAQGKINFAEDYIKENHESLGEDHVKALAGILGFDLFTTVEVTFQVEITAKVTLPLDKKFSDLSEYDFDIRIESNESDYEIDDFEATIERMKES
jgi:hypothetical protein